MLALNPDYRTQDRLIMQLEKLADFKPERILLHTHSDDQFAALIPGRAWDTFFNAEIHHRKQLRWPPYARIVKLTFSHSDKTAAARAASVGADRLRRAMSHLRSPGTQILGPVPALIERAGTRWTHHLIIKSTLPSSRLSELLEYVPEGWAVDVDPRSIS
jgi:primosomal protein N' (replication factor Y)